MQDMFEILKKDYELDLLGQTMCFTQASMYDCIHFSYELQKKDFNLTIWIIDFIKNRIEVKEADLLKVDYNKLFEVLQDTYFKWYFSKKKQTWETYPFEAYIMFLSDKFNLDPDTFLKRYTPEQINFYLEGIIYNLNQQTKDGQKKNRIKQNMKELQKEQTPEEAKEEIRKLLERMDNLKSNK